MSNTAGSYVGYGYILDGSETDLTSLLELYDHGDDFEPYDPVTRVDAIKIWNYATESREHPLFFFAADAIEINSEHDTGKVLRINIHDYDTAEALQRLQARAEEIGITLPDYEPHLVGCGYTEF